MALAQGDTARAMAYADEIVAFLARHGAYDGTGRFAPGLAAIKVLQGASDARASSMLAAAHCALQAKAASIGDAILRERFLTQIAEHRDIVAAWSADQVTR